MILPFLIPFLSQEPQTQKLSGGTKHGRGAAVTWRWVSKAEQDEEGPCVRGLPSVGRWSPRGMKKVPIVKECDQVRRVRAPSMVRRASMQETGSTGSGNTFVHYNYKTIIKL